MSNLIQVVHNVAVCLFGVTVGVAYFAALQMIV
jgi:hypothetical protein